jgi:hypothetical protein
VLDMLVPNEAGKQAAAAIEECVLVSGVVCGLLLDAHVTPGLSEC